MYVCMSVCCMYRTFNEVLLSHAGSDRSIILSVFDTSYAAMAFNLYVTSFVKFNITNYLFIGADPAACQLLQRYQHGERSTSVLRHRVDL